MADRNIRLRSANIAKFLNSEEVKDFMAKEVEPLRDKVQQLTNKPTEIRKSQSTEPRARVEVFTKGLSADDIRNQSLNRALRETGGR